MHLKSRLFILLISSFYLMHCKSSESLQRPVPIQIGKVYGMSSKPDQKEIETLFQLMVQSVLEEKMGHLIPFIHPEEGIWVDLKAGWTKKQYEEDLKYPDGYISTYFLSTEKLRVKKSSSSILSVKDILLGSGGLLLDYYFETSEECEIDILFLNNPAEEGNLSNPVFRKIGGRWYIYRLL
jgi:hypothetical protein